MFKEIKNINESNSEDYSLCLECIHDRLLSLNREKKYWEDIDESLNLINLKQDNTEIDKKLKFIDSLSDKEDFQENNKDEMNERIGELTELLQLTSEYERKRNNQLDEISNHSFKFFNKTRLINNMGFDLSLLERKKRRLLSKSVLSESFNIEIFETFGSVNGRILGIKHPSDKLNWMDINIIFGDITKLVDFIIRDLNINFHNCEYRVFHFGYNSYIVNQSLSEKYFLMGPVNSKNLVILLEYVQ